MHNGLDLNKTCIPKLITPFISYVADRLAALPFERVQEVGDAVSEAHVSHVQGPAHHPQHRVGPFRLESKGTSHSYIPSGADCSGHPLEESTVSKLRLHLHFHSHLSQTAKQNTSLNSHVH